MLIGGIGRELYTAPKIIVWGNPEELKYKEYSVKEIEYNDKREISKIIIVDEKNNVVYPAKSYETKKDTSSSSNDTKTISQAQRKRLFAIANAREDVIREVIFKYGYDKTEQIKMSEYEKICNEIEERINTF